MSVNYNFTMFDKNFEEQFVAIDTYDICEYQDGTITFHLSDTIEEVLQERQVKFIQECMNRVPKEWQTEENLKVFLDIFGLKEVV